MNKIGYAFIFILILSLSACGRQSGRVEESRSESGALQKCLNKACFPEIREWGTQRFRLIGLSSLIKYVKFVVYTAALYLPEREPGVQVPPERDAKILVIRYQRDLEKQQVIDSLRRDLHSMKDIRMEELNERFAQLEAAFEPPAKGDVYDFVFVPGAGLTMIRNGRTLAVIQGDDFGYAFFGVWISPDVEDQKMRGELLGTLKVGAESSGEKTSEELKKKFSRIVPSIKETSQKTVRVTVEAAKKLNPVPLGKKTWQWISRQSLELKERVVGGKP